MKNITAKAFFLLVWLSAAFGASAQEVLDTIFINNPSFEHNADYYTYGWTDCGFFGETPFDPQPGAFECTKKPADGDGYVGMVVRDCETYEAIRQRLTKQLRRGKCYAFSLKLAQSSTYLSASKTTLQKANYDTPARIRIWGGQSGCQRSELLDETNIINNKEWKTYYFKFKPIRNYQYLIIEAFYKTPTLYPYNGNVLVDDASNILEIPCVEDVSELFAALEKKKQPPKKVVKPPKKVVKPKKKDVVIAPPVKKTKTHKTIMPALNKKVSKGQVLRIPNLIFSANSANLPQGCASVIDELYHFLLENPSVKIEIGGHSNNRCDTPYCNSLSEKRAKAVADVLVAKGIDPERVVFKGYGKTNPIATNSTPEGRRKNQRVEVKVLSD